MEKFYRDKCVFVTGAAGTVGSEIIQQLVSEENAQRVVAVDNNESELFFLAQKFRDFSNVEFHLADVRDEDKLTQKMSGADVVIHAAAYKHVVFCEESPDEAIKTNIVGLQNMISSACKNNVRWLAFTSTDKAVNPTSVMGTSKLMGERMITAASRDHDKLGIKMFSVRFGNILGSRGSVMPIFHQQIKEGKQITLTDKGMTRFVMTAEQSARLILSSIPVAKGGEVIVTKMPVIRISDLAEVMIEILAQQYGYLPTDIGIKVIGMKPGEKIYEELMSEQEVERSIDIGNYFAVLPTFKEGAMDSYSSGEARAIDRPYNSENADALSKTSLYEFLTDNRLLDDSSTGRYQPAERFYYVT